MGSQFCCTWLGSNLYCALQYWELALGKLTGPGESTNVHLPLMNLCKLLIGRVARREGGFMRKEGLGEREKIWDRTDERGYLVQCFHWWSYHHVVVQWGSSSGCVGECETESDSVISCLNPLHRRSPFPSWPNAMVSVRILSKIKLVVHSQQCLHPLRYSVVRFNGQLVST